AGGVVLGLEVEVLAEREVLTGLAQGAAVGHDAVPGFAGSRREDEGAGAGQSAGAHRVEVAGIGQDDGGGRVPRGAGGPLAARTARLDVFLGAAARRCVQDCLVLRGLVADGWWLCRKAGGGPGRRPGARPRRGGSP